MNRIHKIIYWISTLWLALGMVSTAIVQLLRQQQEVTRITRLGYPVYFLAILGIWKLLGAIAILIPCTPLLKEWAYAGFFFVVSGAFVSHIVSGQTAFGELFPSVFLFALGAISWYLRPDTRKAFPLEAKRV